jgi:hypothetical protein
MASATALEQYEQALIGALGAIAAHTVVQSKESSRVIRECSKVLDNMSVDLRKTLLELEKSMVISNDPAN